EGLMCGAGSNRFEGHDPPLLLPCRALNGTRPISLVCDAALPRFPSSDSNAVCIRISFSTETSENWPLVSVDRCQQQIGGTAADHPKRDQAAVWSSSSRGSTSPQSADPVPGGPAQPSIPDASLKSGVTGAPVRLNATAPI